MRPQSGTNILVVDNEQKICDLIQVFLDQTGKINQIVTAQNVLQATQKLQNQKFDLLIIDYNMPGKTGIEFIQSIVKNPRYFELKYLLISGCLKKDDAVKAISAGIKHILVKPFGRDQIIRKVFEILSLEWSDDL